MPATINVTLTTMPLMMVMVVMVVMVVAVVAVVVQKPHRLADPGAKSLGASLRDRALRCNLPSVDFRCNPSRLRALRALRADACPAARFAHRRVPADTTVQPPIALAVPPPWSPRAGAVRRARRGPRLARPGRLRRPRASPRLVAVAPPASPVPASPRTELRTAPGTCAPHPCGHVRQRLRQRAPHDCLRLRPHRRPHQAPRRLPSAGFPGVDSPFALPRIPGCFYALRRLVLTPDASVMLALPWPPMLAIGWSSC